MENNFQFVSESQINEVLGMLPYVAREDVKKDLIITQSVERTINRILDGQLTHKDDVASGNLTDEGITPSDPPSSCSLPMSSVPAVSSPTSELPSPSKKRKFVFRRIDKNTKVRRNEFYSDSSDVERDDANTLCSASAAVDCGNLSDDCTDKSERVNFGTGNVTDGRVMRKPEKSHQVVQCISSDEDDHAGTVQDTCAFDFGYSKSHSRTNSSVSDSQLSNVTLKQYSAYSSTGVLSDDSDDLPDLDFISGSCFSRGDSQASTALSSSQTSAFSRESATTASRSGVDSQESQDAELPTLGCSRKRAKIENVAKVQVDRENARQLKKEEQEQKRRVKEEEKDLRQRKRDELQREKVFEKNKKQAVQAARRQAKPGECLKFMTVVIDPAILKTPGGSTLLDTLQKSEVKYEIVPQPLPNIVTFWREVTNIKETEPLQLQSHTHNVVENHLLLELPVPDFIELVYATQKVRRGMASGDVDTVTTYIQRAQDLLEGRKITLLIQKLEGYFRDQKTKEGRAYREHVLGQQVAHGIRGQSSEMPSVTRLDVEEVLLDLQMHCDCNVKLLETDAEFGKMVLHYTRAIAETPFKKDRLKSGLSFHVDKKGCVRVDKDGRGLVTVWRQQLQQFKNVSADMANAIVAEYSSPMILYQAYKKCPTKKSAEELLQDILVRRGAGVLSTSRRIGKELSRRIHQLLTVTDPGFVIS